MYRTVRCTPWKGAGSSIVRIQTVISRYKWIQKGKYLERFIRWKVMGLIGWVSHHMIFARSSWARIKHACMGPSARFRLHSAAPFILCHHQYLISLCTSLILMTFAPFSRSSEIITPKNTHTHVCVCIHINNIQKSILIWQKKIFRYY